MTWNCRSWTCSPRRCAEVSWYGDCLPERDFPTYIDLYRQGRFPLDRFVDERIGIADVEAAFEKMRGGEVMRSVVEFA